MIKKKKKEKNSVCLISLISNIVDKRIIRRNAGRAEPPLDLQVVIARTNSTRRYSVSKRRSRRHGVVYELCYSV